MSLFVLSPVVEYGKLAEKTENLEKKGTTSHHEAIN